MNPSLSLEPSVAPLRAPPVAEAAAPTAPPRRERFSFTGEAREYFRIWIVNLFLSVITIGLYSPWAKVRKKRYLYGHTWLAGANFEYHGNPVAILKGRLIALAALGAYYGTAHFSPRLAGYVALAMMPFLPWLIVRSCAFNARNSSYRNLRFRFDGTYREALAAVAPLFLVPAVGLLMPQFDPQHPPTSARDFWPFYVSPLLLFAVYPYVIARAKIFQVSRTRFGHAPFECAARVAPFYGTYVLGGLIFAGFVAAVVAAGVIGMVVTPIVFVVAVPLGYIVGGAFMFAFVRARITNYLFNATRLAGGGRLHSTLAAFALTRLYAFNLFAIALTLGLAVPWAAMRVARYRAENLALDADGDLGAFVGATSAEVAAAGEEVGEFFDVDLSL